MTRAEDLARRRRIDPRFAVIVGALVEWIQNAESPTYRTELRDACECAILATDDPNGPGPTRFVDEFTIDLEFERLAAAIKVKDPHAEALIKARVEADLKRGVMTDLEAEHQKRVDALVACGQAGIMTVDDVKAHLRKVVPASMDFDVTVDQEDPTKVNVAVVKHARACGGCEHWMPESKCGLSGDVKGRLVNASDCVGFREKLPALTARLRERERLAKKAARRAPDTGALIAEMAEQLGKVVR